jgi:uncharacterized protein YukE
MIRRQWEQATVRVPRVLEECGSVLRRQIADSVETAHAAVPYITANFLAYYIDQVRARVAEARVAFDEALRTLRCARQENREALRPTITDPNNETLLVEVLAKETARTADEAKIVRVLETQTSAIEDTGLKVFIVNLQSLTQQLLTLFDAFVLQEDLKDGPIQPTPRLTLKQMLKEKHRRMANPTNDTRRARPWPPIVQTIAVAVASSEPAPESSKVSPARRGKRAKFVRIELTEKGLSDKVVVPTSLDTPIHRSVIMHRNKVYSEYEKELTERLESMKETVATLTRESQVFLDHWNGCLASLNNEARAMS